MRKLGMLIVISVALISSGCQSFQKDRDLELYIIGAGLTYAAAKHICRTSEHAEKCGVGAAGVP